MASVLEEELCCPVCQEVFVDPVLLSCSHSFCRECLQGWWSQSRRPGPCPPEGPEGLTPPERGGPGSGRRECPLCRTPSLFEPASNRVLKNLCESVLQERRDAPPLCLLHQDRLTLFCLDHQDLVCLVCRDSKRHRRHTFRPVEEAAQDVREQILRDLEPLKDKLQRLRGTQDRWQQTAQHIQQQAHNTRTAIQHTFQKMHRFLAEEEEARLSNLKEEEELKSLQMKKQLEALSGEIAALSQCIKATEEELRSSDSAFLLKHKATKQGVQHFSLMEDPTLPPAALIDVSKHVGNLSFHIWSKMKDRVSYCPVVLDPNTAAADLILSGDLSSVSLGDPQPLPANPERLKSSSVLASQAFSSGSHCWDVEVGGNMLWELGVVEESAHARGDIYSALWRLGFYEDEYRTYCPSEEFLELSVRRCPQKVRVHLNWEKGRLTFSDPDTNTHLHTFTHTFTHRLLPYFSTLDTACLKILAGNVSVLKDQHI